MGFEAMNFESMSLLRWSRQFRNWQKRVLVISLFLLLQSNLVTANDSLNLKYYAGMSGVISPFLEYHPVLPVAESEAQTIPHYRVSTDNNGRLIEIAYFDQAAANNSYFGTHKVQYSYRDSGHDSGNYSRKYYDTDGAPAFMWRHYYQGGDIHEERYQAAEGKRFVALYNDAGEAIESNIGAHKFKAVVLDSKRFLQTQTNLKGDAIPFRNAMPFMSVIVSVDGDGFLDKVLNVAPETLQPMLNQKAGFAALKVNFDENGLELGWEYQDEHGSLVNLPMTDPDEPGAAFTVWFKQWRNQKLNQWSQVHGRYYDKTGAVIADKRGVYLLHYTKDDQNRIAEIAYYGKHDKLHFVQDEGFARKEFHYPDDGSARIEKRYDANNQLLTDE